MLFFSVRSNNDTDKLFQTGNKINENKDIYEINGFQIRFFNKEQIKSLLSFNFKIDKIDFYLHWYNYHYQIEIMFFNFVSLWVSILKFHFELNVDWLSNSQI